MRAADIGKCFKISINFKNFEFQEDSYRGKSQKNVDGESGKTRKKSGKSQGFPCQKFGRHPETQEDEKRQHCISLISLGEI